MRVACFQGPEYRDTPAGNLALLMHTATEARAGGADLLVAPEMFLTGYAIGAEAVARLAEPQDGPSLLAAAKIAKTAGIAIILGFPEAAGGEVFNSAVAFGASGEVIACYRKTHLFGDVDRKQFSEGNDLPEMFEIGGFKVGLLICYDVEFPENARRLALLGADLIVVPTALMQPFDVVAKTIVPARAYENQVFVAYVDRCGSEGEFEYCGLSCVVGPDGADLARAGRSQQMIFADIDLPVLRQSRRVNTHITDRRPQLYQRLTQGMQDP